MNIFKTENIQRSRGEEQYLLPPRDTPLFRSVLLEHLAPTLILDTKKKITDIRWNPIHPNEICVSFGHGRNVHIYDLEDIQMDPQNLRSTSGTNPTRVLCPGRDAGSNRVFTYGKGGGHTCNLYFIDPRPTVVSKMIPVLPKMNPPPPSTKAQVQAPSSSKTKNRNFYKSRYTFFKKGVPICKYII